MTKKPLLRELPKYWDQYFGGRYKPEYEVPTGIAREELLELTERLTTYPAGFHIHPKVKKLLEQRAEMGSGKKPLDYGMAEALAFAGLVKRTLDGSQPDWNSVAPIPTPEGAPNVLLVLTDDAGFGNPSTFGGPIQTPNYTRLAENGLR